MSADEKRISELAHQIWETEGKPEGHDARHWEMARKLAESEALAPKKPSKTNKPKELASVTSKSGKLDGAGDAKPVASKAAGKPSAKTAAKAAAKPAASSTKASAKSSTTKASAPAASSPAAPEKKPRAPRKPSAT